MLILDQSPPTQYQSTLLNIMDSQILLEKFYFQWIHCNISFKSDIGIFIALLFKWHKDIEIVLDSFGFVAIECS